MPPIDLSDFGFPGKEFHYRGTKEDERREGDKLLFLFKEKHKTPGVIKPHAQNALDLILRLDVVSCAGVEERPFAYAGRPDVDIKKERDIFLARLGGEEQVMDHLGNLFFGQAVKLLAPDVPVACVEDPDLYEEAQREYERFKAEKVGPLRIEIYKRLAPDPRKLTGAERMQLDVECERLADERLREEFGNLPINSRRDGPMLENLMALWRATGFEKAAILNTGSKHIDRIKPRLPADVRYIVISQP